ncbi:hypothetical protein GGR53DRAFT_523834 [Hypoxylon sp. FL1150]|nr:hypothetical protein GGR53DRAFT_523834 [Hypoxylon sp. FL1150]
MLDSHEDQPQPFFHKAIAECANRLNTWHSEDPTSCWQKIVDTDTGRVAGDALWNIHKRNPFSGKHHRDVTWLPDDGSRRFAEQALELQSAPRARLGQRSQVHLHIIFTHPDYQRKGIDKKFMDGGMTKANEMGVEMFLDSTPAGKPLYDANGFVEVERNVALPLTNDPDDAWKVTEKKSGQSTWFLVWRPPGVIGSRREPR